MATSYTIVAILPVAQVVTGTNAAPSIDSGKIVNVTFYRDISKPAILSYQSNQDPIGSMEANTWHPATSFYFWDSNINIIRWGTALGDNRQTPTSSLANVGAITPRVSFKSSVPQLSVTSSAVASSGPSLTEGTAGTLSSHIIPSKTSTAPQVSIPAGKQTNGIKNGGVAGVAIGCLIAGGLLAGLVFWFCWVKRKSSRMRDYEASSTALMPRESGFVVAKTASLRDRSPTTSPLAAALALPLEDKALTGEISKISNAIKNHVQSYYHTSKVNPGLLDVDDLQAIGSNLPITAGTLSNLLGNSGTREIALRFCIAYVICSRMKPSIYPSTTLLPIEVAACSQKMADLQREASAEASVARWRMLTAELMQALYVRDPFTGADTRNGSIQAALSALENILQPYADSRVDNGQRKHNLEQILKRAALFAFTLFSRPAPGILTGKRSRVSSLVICASFPLLYSFRTRLVSH